MIASDRHNGNHTELIDQQTFVSSDNSQNGQMATSVGTYESIPSTSIFNLTDKLSIFTYLVNSNRIRWYRVIMRVFLQHHRELYRYQLTAQEVRDAVRSAFDPEYTLDQCQNDLAALREWGNVTTIYDSSRATSIASFLTPALLYQATPEAIAIETFLDEQTRAHSGKGALRQGDLPHLWRSLQQLDEDLQISFSEPTAARSGEIAEEWQRAFEIWSTMAREAAQYLANMINAAQQSRPDFEAYQVYKAAVVAYVHGFAQALTQYSRRVRELLADWSTTAKQERLVAIVSQHLEPPGAISENKPTQDELLKEARNQVLAMAKWFAEGKNADSFRRNALAEVDKVVRRASALAATARPSDWQEPPTVALRLRPVSRANRGEHPLEDPVIDNRTIIRNLIVQHEAKLKEQRLRFEELFSEEYLNIGTMNSITVEDRAILIEVIDSCLGDISNQYRAPDGSTIVLLNPEEQVYTLLRAPDGMLLLPRYRLQRQKV